MPPLMKSDSLKINHEKGTFRVARGKISENDEWFRSPVTSMIEFISLHWCTSDKLSFSLVLRFQHIERRDHPLQLLWERWSIHTMVALRTHLLWTSTGNVIYITGTTSLDTHVWICSKQQGDHSRWRASQHADACVLLHQFQHGTRQPIYGFRNIS